MQRKVAFLFLLLFLITITSGCKIIHIEEESAEPIEYTIEKASALSPDLLELVDERKQEEFEFTYQIDEDLYLVKGYGQQMTGGYSIQVKGVSASATGIFLKTALLGPREKPQHSAPSYPFVVIKIKYRDLPVQFETVLCQDEEEPKAKAD